MTDVAAEGKSLARIDDMVVFAPFCVPGDVVDLQVVKRRKSYCEAKVVRFHKYSDIRTEKLSIFYLTTAQTVLNIVLISPTKLKSFKLRKFQFIFCGSTTST